MVDVSHHAPHGRKPQHCGRWRDRTTLKGTRVNATLCGRLCSDGCEYLQRFVDRNKQGPHVFPGLQVLSTSHASTLQTRILGKKSCLHEPQIPAGDSEHCGHRAGDGAGQPQPHGLGFPGRLNLQLSNADLSILAKLPGESSKWQVLAIVALWVTKESQETLCGSHCAEGQGGPGTVRVGRI